MAYYECEYEMKIKNSDNIKKFIYELKKNESIKEINKIKYNKFNGFCDISVNESMLLNKPNIKELSKKLNITLEIYSIQLENEITEHILIDNGNIIINEIKDFEEYPLTISKNDICEDDEDAYDEYIFMAENVITSKHFNFNI